MTNRKLLITVSVGILAAMIGSLVVIQNGREFRAKKVL